MLSKEFRKDCFLMSGRQEREFDISRRLVFLEKKVETLIQEVQSLKSKLSFADPVVAQGKRYQKVEVELICKDRLVKFQNLESDNLIAICKEVVRAYNVQRPDVIVENVRVNGEWFTVLFKITYDKNNIYVDEVIE